MERAIPEEAIRRILQAGRMTGSSKNAQPNRLILVRDKGRLAAMAALSPLAKWVATADAAVVIAQTQEHQFDAGRCAQSMMLAAFNDGIGSCPAHIPERPLGLLLQVPEGVFVNRVIAFGYVDPARDAPHPAVARPRLLLEELVHEETWQASS